MIGILNFEYTYFLYLNVMKIFIPIVSIIILISSCGNNTNTKVKDVNVVKMEKVTKDTLPPLEEGEYTFTDDVFGDIIELKGTSCPVDQIFRVSSLEMIIKDSIMIVSNKNGDNAFMAYSLPDFKFIKSFGLIGRGPDEFQIPHLVKSEDENVLCYVYSSVYDKIYSLDKDFVLKKMNIKLPSGENQYIGNKQIQSFSETEFLYVESIKGGKAIFDMKIQSDTVSRKLIKKLSFSSACRNWAACIGDFGASKKHGRVVYAYKKYKRLLFMDLKDGKTRVVKFKTNKKTKKGNVRKMLSADNVTHYWGISAHDDYVYVLYSGRTPIQVGKENEKTSGYIFVEQYDWNGNPIRKFKLDHWGYFCVNEAEDMIYLASYIEEQPFLKFEIPKLMK